MAVPTCGQVAIDEKLQILVREQELLQEKRAAGLTNETFHPWMNEWLSHEEMVKEKVRAYMPSNLCIVLNLRHLPIAQADAEKRLAPIRKVVNELLALPLDAKPSQSKKSIKAQESAIAALANLEYYDLADPGLLSQLAVLDKRFPWPPDLRGAPELPDESRETIPWLPVAARDAICWTFCNPRLNHMELQRWVEFVFAKL